jgi:tetratricopeptide (TPR) repeat protein
LGAVHEEVSAALARHDLDAARAALERAELLAQSGDSSAFEIAQLRLVAGRVCAAEGDYACAVRQAVSALECVAGLPVTSDVARLTVQARLDLSDAHVGSGDLKSAGEMLIDALAEARTTLGEDDPDTASAWNSLGMWHRYRGEIETAADAYARARQILEDGGPNEDLASVLHNEASLAHLRGDLAEAEVLIRKAMSLRADAFGNAEDLGVLAVIAADGDRFEEAQAAYDQARQTLLHSYGPSCVELVFLSGNEAVLSYRCGRLDEAEARYGQALAASESLLGPDHPYTGEVLANLGALQEATDKTRAAHVSAARAISILSAIVEESHPSLQLAREVAEATAP